MSYLCCKLLPKWINVFITLCVFQDKTFGLKNKKGAKQQKFIKNVTQQVKYGQQSARQVGGSSFHYLLLLLLSSSSSVSPVSHFSTTQIRKLLAVIIICLFFLII